MDVSKVKKNLWQSTLQSIEDRPSVAMCSPSLVHILRQICFDLVVQRLCETSMHSILAHDGPGMMSCLKASRFLHPWHRNAWSLNHIREFREKAGTTRTYWNGRDVIAKLHPLARRLEITEHHRTSSFQYVEVQRYLLLSPAFQVWCSIIAFLNVLFWSWFIVFEARAALPSADEIDGPPPLLCGIGDWFRDSTAFAIWVTNITFVVPQHHCAVS